MQESNENKIRHNLSALVDLTSSVGNLVKSLREKHVFSEQEEDAILRVESPFDQKSQLYWAITKKDDSAFEKLIESLKSTGNDEAAQKLLETSSVSADEEAGKEVMEAEVIIESHKEPDQEGIDFAEEIEREFERIQTEQGEEAEETQLTTSFQEEETQEKELKSVQSDDEESVQESQVKVEITPPEPEEDVNGEPTTTDEQVNPVSPKVQFQEAAEEEVEQVAKEEEEKAQSPASDEPTYVTGDDDNKNEEEPVQLRRQVQFQTYNENGNNNKNDDSGSEESNSPGVRKSIVQLNKEKFEKNAPVGVKVKYSFRKEEPAVETPKESTVKNLRNFFQKLSSVDAPDGSPTKTKLGGIHPNRKSMAS